MPYKSCKLAFFFLILILILINIYSGKKRPKKLGTCVWSRGCVLPCYPDVGLTRKTSRRDCHYPRPDGPLARNRRHVTYFSSPSSVLSPGNPVYTFFAIFPIRSRAWESSLLRSSQHTSSPIHSSSIHDWELQVLLAPRNAAVLACIFIFFQLYIYIVNNMVFSLVWFRLVWSSLV